MTTPLQNNPPPDDLMALAAALDRLAALDRAAAPQSLEARVLAGVLTEACSVAPVAARVDDLAATDRAAAAIGLEDRVHDASRAELAPEPALRLAGTPASVETATVVRRAWWSHAGLRVAAALLLATGAVVAYRASIAPVRTDAGIAVADAHTRAAALDGEIAAEMSQLFSVMDEQSTAKTASDLNTDDIAEWLSQGASS